MNINQTYHFHQSNEDIRIIALEESDIYYIIMDGKKGCAIKVMAKTQLIELLESGEVTRIPDPFLTLNNNFNLSTKSLERAKRNVGMIEELWGEHREEILDKKTRVKLIKEFARKKDCSEYYLRQLLGQYLKGGMKAQALLPRFENCGHKGASRSLKSKSAPHKLPTPLTKEVEDIFEKSYREFYLAHPHRTIHEAYHQMLGTYFFEEGNCKSEKNPSYIQFWRWIKEQDKQKRIETKFSPQDFQREHRTLTGSTSATVEGPGECFEIDATILDCHIVSRSNRNKVIGRPVLYLIVDRYSRMIVGMNVGLDAPSWIGAVSALENIVEDKVEYCSRFKIDISSLDWPVKGQIPKQFIGDRGEMISFNSNLLLETGCPEVCNTAPYRGDLKANVERRFGIINPKICSFIDGAVLKEYRKRGDKDPRDEAKLNLEEITRVCIHCVLSLNKRLIRDFPLREDQIAFGVAPIPLQLWNYGREHYLDSLIDVDIDSFRTSLLPRERRSVNRRGIKFKNLFYTAADAYSANWIANHQQEKFEFYYDPVDMSKIHVIDGENTITLKLSETFVSFEKLSLEEIQAYQEMEQKVRESLKDEQTELSVELNEKLEEINAAVPEVSRAVSRAERKKNIRENRQKERQNDYPQTPTSDIYLIRTREQDPLINCHDRIDEILKGKSGKND